jgi:hypothetical protein
MRVPRPTPRRRLLGGLASLLVTGTLAGCTGDDGESTGDDSEPGDDSSSQREETEATETESGGGDTGDESEETDNGDDENSGASTETPATDELDLREANVIGVSVETAGGDSYRFDVTLHHDDDGEDGYANWWQVESLDGTQLGRRELLHAHSQQPFTRSGTFEVSDASCVVVRGHDQTHGYGGQAMVVDIASGETNPVRQGSERQQIDESACP